MEKEPSPKDIKVDATLEGGTVKPCPLEPLKEPTVGISLGPLRPCDMCDAELVALARSQALRDDMDKRGLMVSTSSVYLTHINGMRLVSPIPIEKALSPLEAAAAIFVESDITALTVLIKHWEHQWLT